MMFLKVLSAVSLALAIIIVALGMLLGGTTDTTIIGVLFFVAFCVCWSAVEIISRLDAQRVCDNWRLPTTSRL